MMIQVIDFETTGLTDPQPVQFGRVTLNKDLTVNSTSEIIIKPTKPMEWGAMAITGLTPEYIEQNYELGYSEVADGLTWIPSNTEYVVTHNAQYDTKFIHQNTLAKVKVVCTLKLARKLIDKSLCGDHKNATLYYYLGCYKNPVGAELINKQHSALSDAMMTTNVLLALLKLGNLTIEQAYQLISGKTEQQEDITICPFKKHSGKSWKQVAKEDKEYLQWLLDGGKIRSEEMVKYVKKLL
jgi:DNA polymerase III epsilon subunit-like protein